MKDNESLLYNVSGSEALTDPERVEQLVKELMKRGYFLFTRQEDSLVFAAWLLQLDPPWPHWSAEQRAQNQEQAAPYLERIFTPGVSEQLHQQIERFKEGQQETLYIGARSIERVGPLHNHQFDLHLAPVRKYLALNYTNDFWVIKRNDQDSAAAFDHFLGIVEVLYDLYRPFYAYAWNHNNAIPVTESDYLEQRKPYTLYDINLFGPEMVDNLGGREFVLKAPAQVVRELSDGGVLMIPKAPWYPGSLGHSWSKVAKYLGVVCPDFAVGDDWEEDE
jgi:hypothetical protein